MLNKNASFTFIMIFPRDCGEVSLIDVDFPLDRYNIQQLWKGNRIYAKTKYLVLRNDRQYAVIKVHRSANVYVRGKKKLFYPITGIEIISMPEETVFLRDEKVNVCNIVQMAERYLHFEKTIIVDGMWNHINFLHKPRLISLTGYEIFPPVPAKLMKIYEQAVESNLIEYPVIAHWTINSLYSFINRCKHKYVVIPCSAGFTYREYSKRILFFEKHPDLPDDPISLIGCNLTLRAFRELYSRNPEEFINICPQCMYKHTSMCMFRCCKVKHGFDIHGRTITVSQNPSCRDVADGINELVRHLVP